MSKPINDYVAKLEGLCRRHQREAQKAKERVAELDRLVKRASPFVNAVAVMAEDKTLSLAWIADAAAALPHSLPTSTHGADHE